MRPEDHTHTASCDTIPAPAGEPIKSSPLPFDGIICFGGLDWWYHNRGHYDLQMMRELSTMFPVLYVNSLGMRTPRPTEGAMFFARVFRKLKSFSRGFRPVRKNFSVLSLVYPPFLRTSAVVRRLAARRVARTALRMGIRRPAIWVNCPPAAELVDLIPHVRLVYQRTDRFEAFPDIDLDQIQAYDRRLKQADLTLYCSSSLMAEESDRCRRAEFVDHGVDYDYFSTAETGLEPADLSGIPRPRIGFIGGIDPHTFDPGLFLDVARALPDHAFVMVGNCTLAPGWCDLPNVHLLGQRPYETVARYMAACDVLIMPWLRNEWIRACNPIKLKEYLASGHPVVTTPFDEIERYRDHVTVATSADDFASAVRAAATAPPDPERLRRLVREETWQKKAALVLGKLGTAPAGPHR